MANNTSSLNTDKIPINLCVIPREYHSVRFSFFFSLFSPNAIFRFQTARQRTLIGARGTSLAPSCGSHADGHLILSEFTAVARPSRRMLTHASLSSRAAFEARRLPHPPPPTPPSSSVPHHHPPLHAVDIPTPTSMSMTPPHPYPPETQRPPPSPRRCVCVAMRKVAPILPITCCSHECPNCELVAWPLKCRGAPLSRH